MPLGTDDVYRRLISVLLRGPRQASGEESSLYRRNAQLLSLFGFAPQQSPVVGVAMTLEDTGTLSIYIFLRIPVEGFAKTVQESLELAKFPLQQLTVGDIRPTARQARGGHSLGEGVKGGKSGTFGCLVEDGAGQKSILTCSHVLSEVNQGVKGSDVIWQPSSGDGGSITDRIGVLQDFAPIHTNGTTRNDIDAALVTPDSLNDTTDGLVTIGSINGSASNVQYRTSVQKVGWKTGHTRGTLLYRTSFINNYPGQGDALFEDQIGIVGGIGAFSTDGDSGSIVINDQSEVVGMIFADAPDIQMTFANPIDKVFSYFGVGPV